VSTPVVFLNKGLASTSEILAIVRSARLPGEFRVLASHPRADFPGRHAADEFEIEPDGLDDDAYVAWCLDFVRRHGVTLFMPGRRVWAIVRARERFHALGAQIYAAGDTRTLALLDDKGACYAALDRSHVPVPDHRVVPHLAGFETAVLELLRRGHRVCFKPTRSVYGFGFRIIVDRGYADGRLSVTLAGARRYLLGRPFRPQLVMQFLSGVERSVDCLAHRGQLVCAVIRRKSFPGQGAAHAAALAALDPGGGHASRPTGDPQWLEDNPRIQAIVERLTATLRLDGLFNVQFRDDAAGSPYLLEINGRMSGGLPMACRSGVPMPYWAIRLALGTASVEDVPVPRVGFVVSPFPEHGTVLR
jgi:hypothetical protein